MMKKILLVEDDPFLVDIYTTKLKKAGYDVTVAIDGEECLKKVEEIIPELVLLDIVLPNIDGWELLKKMKKNSKLKDVKIIVLSNLGNKDEVEKGVKLGALKYLIKAEHTPSEVVEEVDEILKK